MFINIFEFNGEELVINKPEVLLYPEFKAVWYAEFNKTKEDPENERHTVARKVFAFAWLYADYRSDLMEMDEENRFATALSDSGADREIIKTEIVHMMLSRYVVLQETRILRSLKVANRTLDKLLKFMDGLNLDERNEKGMLVHSAGAIMKQISEIGKVAAGIEELEYMTKKDMEKKSKIRGEDTEEGMFD